MSKWLIISSLILTAVLALVILDSRRQEFPGYQKAYFGAVAGNTPSQAVRQWAQDQRIDVKQQFLSGLGRLDRCQTCHLAVEDLAFKDSPEPLRTHPGLLDSHPPELFGCMSCHGGDGQAVTTLEAHGEAKNQTKRLFRGEYMQAACYQCHGQNTLPPDATGAVVKGKQLVNSNMCLRCHQINGNGGNEGPDLSVVGSRRDRVWIYGHFINPQAMNLVSTMPRFPLSRDEIRYLTTYLLTLRGGAEKVTNADFIAHKTSSAGWQWPPVALVTGTPQAGNNAIPQVTYNGEELFTGAGCKTCHTIGNRGGEVGPVLTHIARKYDREWFVRLLRNPADVFPQGQMPQLYLNEKQVQALADYLATLR